MTTNSQPEKSDTVSVNVPFEGFYNSIHDTMLDIAMSGINEDDEGVDQEIIGVQNVSWPEVHLSYAQTYLSAVIEITKIPMRFDKIISPRDYSMGNDKIIAFTPLEGVKAMFSSMDKEKCDAWRARVAEEMSPRPGFAPYSRYSDDADEWGPVEDWDDAQRDLFFDFHVAPLLEDADIAHDMSDNLEDLIWKNVIDPNLVPGHVDNENEKVPEL